MAAKRLKPRTQYTDAERYQLLTGMVQYVGSTRFGGPKWHVPIDVAEVQIAWLAIGDELVQEFQADRYTKYRERWGGTTWAEQVMAGTNGR